MIVLPRLYTIADASFGNPVDLALALAAGGARLIQIRNKKAGARELLAQVDAVVRAVPAEVAILVNDRADIALLSGAAGVHLGQDDLPAGEARKILGATAIIGLSTHNMAQAVLACKLPIDYLAAGPIYPTNTKENPAPVLGLENLKQICRSVALPVVAIGGMTLERAPEVLAAGASSVAVIRDLLAGDVAGRTREWASLL